MTAGAGLSKDMGGLLQQDGRDFFLFQSGHDDNTKALQGNQKLGLPVHVIRKVMGPNPLQSVTPSAQTVYVYCGKYEVVEGWHADTPAVKNAKQAWYFKLFRLKNQPVLTPQQMAFAPYRKEQALSFKMTWKAYAKILEQDCSMPCEKMNPHNGSGINAQHDAQLAECDFCDVCGMDCVNMTVQRCGCCQDKGLETVACPSCIPFAELQWVSADQDHRHWRCSQCRTAHVKPQTGLVYQHVEPSATPMQSQQQLPASPLRFTPQQPAASGLARIAVTSPFSAAELFPRHKRKKQRLPKKAVPSWPVAANPAALLATSAPAIQQLPATLLQASSSQPVQNLTAVSAAVPQSATPASQVQPLAVVAVPANSEPSLSTPVGVSAAAPATVSELVSLVNVQLKPEHQITQAQVSALQEALGDVETLLELSIMQAGALNEVLRDDGNLHGVQIVAVRRTLKQLGS